MKRPTVWNLLLSTAFLASCASSQDDATTDDPVAAGEKAPSERKDSSDDDATADDDTANDDHAGDDDTADDDVADDDVAGDDDYAGDDAADDDAADDDYVGDDDASGDDLAAEEGAPTVEQEPADPLDSAINPFVVAAHDPLSTFAVDVDTASYDIFRRDLGNGRLPSPEQVRLEEFVNFFAYDYPVPAAEAEEPFAISLAAAPNLLDSGTSLLRVGIQGAQYEKRPANLVFLIDTSGSMASAEKLPVVKRVLTEALDVLDSDDRISIVTYAGTVGVLLDSTPVSERATVAEAIDGLGASGSTNGEGGIQTAYDQAEAGYVDGGTNHVILCTDGDFNVGVSSTAGLVDLIEQKRTSGVTLTALGFGASNNDAMMEAVSNAGNGVYAVIANEDQAVSYVHTRLLQSLTFIAKDVKIQVEWNPEHVLAYRLLGYQNRAIADQDFRDDTVDAGEIGAEHRVTALYEVVLAGNAVPVPDGAPDLDDGAAFDGVSEVAPEDLALVKVRYKHVDATEQDAAFEVAARLASSEVASSALDLDEDFQWAMALATFAEVLAHSPFADTARLDEIAPIIVGQRTRDAERGEFAVLFEQARELLSSAGDE